jgi:hypothetical protein
MGKQPLKHSFTSTLGKQVAATQLPSTSAERLHPRHQEVDVVSEEEDDHNPVPRASRKVSNFVLE